MMNVPPLLRGQLQRISIELVDDVDHSSGALPTLIDSTGPGTVKDDELEGGIELELEASLELELELELEPNTEVELEGHLEGSHCMKQTPD
jgi:hypothetical protein